MREHRRAVPGIRQIGVERVAGPPGKGQDLRPRVIIITEDLALGREGRSTQVTA
jgi:hypothetical protein